MFEAGVEHTGMRFHQTAFSGGCFSPRKGGGRGIRRALSMLTAAAMALLPVACKPKAAPDAEAPGPADPAGPAAADAGLAKVSQSGSVPPWQPIPNARSVDDFVFGRLKQLKIRPAPLCPDEVFVRRVFIDVLGTVPTAEEAAAFLKDRHPDKRRRLIESLFDRPEFADYWAMKWSDLLRIKAEFPINLWPNAAQAYHRWVRESIAKNKPYDQMAREMLTASGSNFRVGQVNFYRAMQNRTPEGIARTVALTFMGTRAEKWPAEKLAAFSGCFSEVGYKPTREWKEQIVYWDPEKPAKDARERMAARTNHTEPYIPVRTVKDAVLPDGTKLRPVPGTDPRAAFADWLIRPDNPWFARCIVNRVWAWLMGRGIVHPFDDIRPDNPPCNPGLLTFLERELVRHNYDLRRLYRLILNSRAYQLSCKGPSDNPVAVANFACYPLRRLEAEVLIDSINKVTGTYDLYTSAIPEPFTYIPKDIPAVAIADGSITSPFLALFGRSPRATGFSDERDNRMLASQWLHLLNSTHIYEKIAKGPGLRRIREAPRTDRKTLDRLYLRVLSRPPTEAEARVAMAYNVFSPSTQGADRAVWIDRAWALVNSDEFLFRH